MHTGAQNLIGDRAIWAVLNEIGEGCLHSSGEVNFRASIANNP
jgi:hypothetical protein